MTESYLWMCLWYTLCFIICLSAVHNYMSRGIISLAELSCWCPNTLFFSLFLFHFQESRTNYFRMVLYLELWIKKPCLLWLSFTAVPSHVVSVLVPLGKSEKQTNNTAAVCFMIGHRFCFDLFPLVLYQIVLIICSLFILATNFCCAT